MPRFPPTAAACTRGSKQAARRVPPPAPCSAGGPECESCNPTTLQCTKCNEMTGFNANKICKWGGRLGKGQPGGLFQAAVLTRSPAATAPQACAAPWRTACCALTTSGETMPLRCAALCCVALRCAVAMCAARPSAAWLLTPSPGTLPPPARLPQHLHSLRQRLLHERRQAVPPGALRAGQQHAHGGAALRRCGSAGWVPLWLSGTAGAYLCVAPGLPAPLQLPDDCLEASPAGQCTKW